MLAEEPKTIDLRVRKTRMHLEKAFVDLLREKSFEEITVHMIAGRAMVNRATFYDHFTDKYALFAKIVEKQFLEQLKRNTPVDGQRDAVLVESLIVTVCQFMAGLNDQCRPTDPSHLPPVDDFITGTLASTLRPVVTRAGHGKTALPADQITEVACWALYGAARYWSRQTNREPVRPYASRIAPALLALLHGSVAHSS